MNTEIFPEGYGLGGGEVDFQRACDKYLAEFDREIRSALCGNPYGQALLRERISLKIATPEKLAELNARLRNGGLDHGKAWL